MGIATSNYSFRLYVKSIKTVTGTMEVEHEAFGSVLDDPGRVKIEGSVTGGTFRVRQFAMETEPKHEFVLSEDQQRIVEMVMEVGRRYSAEIEVVDVARENVLHRALQRELEKIKGFPTLIASSGEKIEGDITERQVESLISQTANRARKTYL